MHARPSADMVACARVCSTTRPRGNTPPPPPIRVCRSVPECACTSGRPPEHARSTTTRCACMPHTMTDQAQAPFSSQCRGRVHPPPRAVHAQDKVDPLNAWKTAFDACSKQGKIRGADGKCNPLAAQCQVRATHTHTHTRSTNSQQSGKRAVLLITIDRHHAFVRIVMPFSSTVTSASPHVTYTHRGHPLVRAAIAKQTVEIGSPAPQPSTERLPWSW